MQGEPQGSSHDPPELKLQLRGIMKSFASLQAVKGVDFDCQVGEVHSLLGENGAGKSTLMNIVAGVLAPDAGQMWLDREPYQPTSPKRAIRSGVGMVHQNYQLIPRLSVAENLFLGWEGAPRVSSLAKLASLADAAIDQHGFHMRPLATVRELSVGEQQRVAILRALVRGASLLILDEPTATLTPQEAEALFESMRRLAADGRVVIFITHKLREVMAVSSRVTVLRAGSRVATLPISECDERILAQEMLGRDVDPPRKSAARRRQSAAPAIKITAGAIADDRGSIVVSDLSLEVQAHEIVGVAGVSGNGQRELSEAAAGVRPLVSGRIEIGGADLTGRGAAAFVKAGVGYVPEDRLTAGMVLRETIAHNAIMKALYVDSDRRKLTRGPWLRSKEVQAFARQLLEEGQVSTRDPKAIVGNLSGGNIQRLLIARELRAARRALVAVHPTRGLDIGAMERAWRILIETRDSGLAVLLISEDLDEVLTLSDRVLVMYSGQIVGEFDNREVSPSRERLGLLMGGSTGESLAESKVASVPGGGRS
jgi:ABC-type uncharacterized transport system ATPase subunit